MQQFDRKKYTQSCNFRTLIIDFPSQKRRFFVHIFPYPTAKFDNLSNFVEKAP